jgi:tetratricopeptide (TPR) repeat protein
MGYSAPMRALASLALVLVLAGPAMAEKDTPAGPQSSAENRSETLDRLFAILQTVKDPGEARTIEGRIWSLWSESDSPTAEALLTQSYAAMRAEDNDASLAILDQTVKSYPDFAEAWNRRALVHFMRGEDAKALADADKALDLEPRHFGALIGRGMILQKLGKAKEAIKAFEDALAANPQEEDARTAIKILEKLERDI